LTIEVTDPVVAAARWAAVLGASAATGVGSAAIELPAAGQRLRFVQARSGRGEGISAVTIAGLPGAGARQIGGVSFVPQER
jgi:hypothetical protein